MNAAQYIDRLFEGVQVLKLQNYWLDKDGELHPVLGHQSGAVELRPDLFKDKLPGGVTSTPRASEIIYRTMYAEGYVRVTVDGWETPGMIYVSKGGEEPNSTQIRALRDLAIEKDFGLQVDRGPWSQLLYTPTGRDLKESVQIAVSRLSPGSYEYYDQVLDQEELETALEIEGIEVDRGERGQGLGSAAIKKVLDRAEAEECAVVLWVMPTDVRVWPEYTPTIARLISFYQRLGFKQVKPGSTHMYWRPNS